MSSLVALSGNWWSWKSNPWPRVYRAPSPDSCEEWRDSWAGSWRTSNGLREVPKLAGPRPTVSSLWPSVSSSVKWDSALPFCFPGLVKIQKDSMYESNLKATRVLQMWMITIISWHRYVNTGWIFPLKVIVGIVLKVSALKHIKKTCAETWNKSASTWCPAANVGSSWLGCRAGWPQKAVSF